MIDAKVYLAPRGDGDYLACAPRGLQPNEVLDEVTARRPGEWQIEDSHQICPTDGSRRHWKVEPCSSS